MTGVASCVAPAPATSFFPASWRERSVLITLLLLLPLACVLQLIASPDSAPFKRQRPLAEYFPTTIAGWTGEDRPLGETESVSKTALKLLNYDEAFQRVYRKNGKEFVVYVAYWKAGKVPARDVAFHTPDQCWVGVGWKRMAIDYRYQPAFEGHLLAPAQYREFDSPGDRVYVLYWHILNGQSIVYSADGPPSQIATIKELFRHGYAHKGEQYFIRLSSEIPPNLLWTDEGFQSILELIAPFGPGFVSKADPIDR